MILNNLASARGLKRAIKTVSQLIKGAISLIKRNRFLKITSRPTLIGLTRQSVYLHTCSKDQKGLSTSGVGAASRKKRTRTLSNQLNLAAKIRRPELSE